MENMFDNEETQNIVEKKLLPVLEELARAEFGTYSFAGAVDEVSVAWMENSLEMVKEIVGGYLGGLLRTHIEHGKLRQKLRGDLDNSGN